MLISFSKNTYILSPRSVTLQPILFPSLNLNPAIDFLAFVTTGFCPAITVNSLTAASKYLESVVASPTPMLSTIFSSFGTSILEVYPNFSIRAGVISSLYFFFNVSILFPPI